MLRHPAASGNRSLCCLPTSQAAQRAALPLNDGVWIVALRLPASPLLSGQENAPYGNLNVELQLLAYQEAASYDSLSLELYHPVHKNKDHPPRSDA